EHGLVLALTQIEMPLLLLPLLSVMSRLDPNLRDASAGLGASKWRTLFRITLPLSLPGLVAGCMLVFASSTTAFISQFVIGGNRLVYLPLLIWQQSLVVYNWPLASAAALVPAPVRSGALGSDPARRPQQPPGRGGHDARRDAAGHAGVGRPGPPDRAVGARARHVLHVADDPADARLRAGRPHVLHAPGLSPVAAADHARPHRGGGPARAAHDLREHVAARPRAARELRQPRRRLVLHVPSGDAAGDRARHRGRRLPGLRRFA